MTATPFPTASEIRKNILCGVTTAQSVIEAAVARAKQVQGALNPFTVILEEEAIKAAQSRDRDLAIEGKEPGPLHGVPIVIKDMTPTKGHPTTLGSLTTGDGITDFDAVVVRRLKDAGAIVIGKTTTAEFAFSSFTRSKRYGNTLNPWNSSRTPGGSSGGSAVAVATGVVPLAEGTDMGGSVRIPAAACGIVGFKPSLGRIPMTILPTGLDTISHFGPLASCVHDAVTFVAATAGQHPADLLSKCDGFAIGLTSPSGLRGLRIAISRDLGYCAVQDDVAAALDEIAANLSLSGATLVDVKLPWTRAVYDEWSKHWNVLLALFPTGQSDAQLAQMDPDLAACIRRGRGLSALDLMRVDVFRTKMSSQLRSVMRDCDVLICPTNAIEAPSATALDSDFERNAPDGRFQTFDMAHPFNMVSDRPALSLPIGLSKSGLPIGLQIVGHPHADERVLSIAGAIEAMRGPFPTPPNFQR
jgi:Asp-tRNA(Asn)/Glu-tRNA(Gln) amidotransferase A subunit family amidase